MKITFMLLIVGVALGVAPRSANAQEASLTIASKGRTSYRIVVGVAASMQDYYAAQQLQYYIREMSGAAPDTIKPYIIADDGPLVEKEFIVGFNRHTARLAPELEEDSFGPEEFEIKTVGQTVIIVGGSPRGVVYGVTSLLTEEWNCRWFTPQLKRIPTYEPLMLPPVNRRYKPSFEWRESYFWSGLDNEWALHNFSHNFTARLRHEQGGRGGFSAGQFLVHTILQLVPPDQYMAEHPDYYWTGYGDQPRSGRTTEKNITTWLGVCLSHPDTPAIAAQTLREYHRQSLEGDIYLSISSQDYDDWCECPRCKGHPAGELWFEFASQVVALLQEEPDVPKISLLAYGYAVDPPASGYRARLNIILADMGQCQIHSIADPECERNQIYRRRLAGWAERSDSTYAWLYRVNFGYWMLVHPNMDVIAEDMRYLRDAGVAGVYAQGNQHGWMGQRFDGGMNELRAYLMARLMWNPDLDWQEERRDFLQAYYGGAAGKEIAQYLDDVRAKFMEHEVHSYCYLEPEQLAWITPQMIERWYSYMDRAEAAALDKERARLVRIARLPILFTELQIETDPVRRQVLVNRFMVQAEGLVTRIGEGYSIKDWAQDQK